MREVTCRFSLLPSFSRRGFDRLQFGHNVEFVGNDFMEIVCDSLAHEIQEYVRSFVHKLFTRGCSRRCQCTKKRHPSMYGARSKRCTLMTLSVDLRRPELFVLLHQVGVQPCKFCKFTTYCKFLYKTWTQHETPVEVSQEVPGKLACERKE